MIADGEVTISLQPPDNRTGGMAKETRVWGRFVNGPGTPMKGETLPEELKQRFRAK